MLSLSYPVNNISVVMNHLLFFLFFVACSAYHDEHIRYCGSREMACYSYAGLAFAFQTLAQYSLFLLGCIGRRRKFSGPNGNE